MEKHITHPPFDVFNPKCPSRQAFDQIFSRWGILTLVRLSETPIRFGALRRAIGGISEKMLAQTLKVLEEKGLVKRQEWDTTLPCVEYSLTDAGVKLAAHMHDVITDLYAQCEQRLATALTSATTNT